MPIHYASILSQRNVVVLQGVYATTQTSFKTQVVQYAQAIKPFGYGEAALQSNLRVLYHNWGTVTAAIVVSNEIDRQECQEFMENYKNFVETNLLGKKPEYKSPAQIQMQSQTSTDADDQLYMPFQAASAETTFRQYQPKLDTFITQWNDNPNNRSKMGQLRQSLEETKAVVMDDLEQTLIRGQNLQDTKGKSEQLKDASVVMKKSSKDVKMKMCCRKYMYWIIGILVTIGFALFLYFILR